MMYNKRASEPLPEKAARTISSYSMLDTKSVLVGFSGGVDSTVLLFLLKRFCLERGIVLHALHVNHMIRGEEADRDEAFCRDFCREHRIDFYSVRIDVPTIAKREKIGLEECARKYRYLAYEEHCVKYCVERIATAHNADDNIETLLFNIARGCSLSGICGIAPVRGNIIRPLIACSKDEIISFAREISLDYVYDSTNSDNAYTRNFIRHDVIPDLKKINPSLSESVTRLTDSARRDAEFLSALASEHTDVDDAAALSKLPLPILSRVLSAKFKKICDIQLETVHIDALCSLVTKARDASACSLPGNLCAFIDSGKLRFRDDIPTKETPPSFTRTLEMGINSIPEIGACFYVTESAEDAEKYKTRLQNINNFFKLIYLNYDRINGDLYVRNRHEGDRYRFRGMTRSVKKLLCDAKLSSLQKSSLPFLCDDDGIIWIPGFEIRDSAKANDNDRRLYIIYHSEIRNV